MKTVSIGTMREDGDFAILATLNNNDEGMNDIEFRELVNHVASTLCRALVCAVEVIERQDAPDYINLGE